MWAQIEDKLEAEGCYYDLFILSLIPKFDVTVSACIFLEISSPFYVLGQQWITMSGVLMITSSLKPSNSFLSSPGVLLTNT